MNIPERIAQSIPQFDRWWLQNTEQGQRIVQEYEDNIRRRRQELIDRKQELHEEKERLAEDHGKSISQARKEYDRAWKALKTATQKLTKAKSKADSDQSVRDRELQDIDRELMHLPSLPEVDDFIRWAKAELRQLSRSGPRTEFRPYDDGFTVRQKPVRSNVETYRARSESLLEAEREARELPYEVSDEDEIRKRIRQLRKGIPEVKMEPVS